jgi:hypothetical protein
MRDAFLVISLLAGAVRECFTATLHGCGSHASDPRAWHSGCQIVGACEFE